MNNGDKDSMTITFYDNAGQTVASYVINIERVNSDVQLTFAYSIGSDYGGENFQWTNTDAYDDKLYTGQINSVSLQTRDATCLTGGCDLYTGYTHQLYFVSESLLDNNCADPATITDAKAQACFPTESDLVSQGKASITSESDKVYFSFNFQSSDLNDIGYHYLVHVVRTTEIIPEQYQQWRL